MIHVYLFCKAIGVICSLTLFSNLISHSVMYRAMDTGFSYNWESFLILRSQEPPFFETLTEKRVDVGTLRLWAPERAACEVELAQSVEPPRWTACADNIADIDHLLYLLGSRLLFYWESTFEANPWAEALPVWSFILTAVVNALWNPPWKEEHIRNPSQKSAHRFCLWFSPSNTAVYHKCCVVYHKS